jgi:ABC-type uncharacterized transport system fused permease/ATPase subunit
MKELKGKQLSLFSKIIAMVFLFAGFFVMLLTGSARPVGDLITVGLTIAGIFAPIDASMVVNNFKKPREGNDR